VAPDPDYPTDWLLAVKDGGPDTLLGYEFYKGQAAFDRHYYQDPAVEQKHDHIIDVLGGAPHRQNVSVEASNID